METLSYFSVGFHPDTDYNEYSSTALASAVFPHHSKCGAETGDWLIRNPLIFFLPAQKQEKKNHLVSFFGCGGRRQSTATHQDHTAGISLK